MQTKITSIGKRLPLKLSMSICAGFGTAVYPSGPSTFANATEPLSSVLLAEPQRPLADRLVGDDDTPTGHEVFDVTKAQRKAEVEPDYVADDLAGVAEAAVKLSICHLRILEERDSLCQVDSTPGERHVSVHMARLDG
jgi:hypothetical protein